MELIKFEDYLKIINKKKMIVGIGQFDGMHLAHRRIVDEVCRQKASNDYVSALITFNPHPLQILKGIIDNTISSLEDKIIALSNTNLEYLIVIDFTKEFSCISPKEFVMDYLIKINVCQVVVGFDFSFGYKGLGKASDITSLSNNLLTTTIIDEIKMTTDKISSSLIRTLLEEGNVEKANSLLGYPYSFKGYVEKGSGIGRTINFPTANLHVLEKSILLSNGVYGVIVHLQGINKVYFGIMNIGHNPSINYQNNLRIEVNIIDFSGDIYGQTLYIEVVRFLRFEKKFDTKEELISQLNHDKEDFLLSIRK